ncbi:hypothetical protein Pelo_10129 [Pelomyxa schiedti]|nr:hypothetical protein Pelo_10129 [Pelomyxa schiedti]
MAATTTTTTTASTATNEDQRKAQPVSAGKELTETLQGWLKAYRQHRLCAVGINNYTHKHQMSSPSLYMDSGRSLYEFPDNVGAGQGAPSLYGKRTLAPKGVAGCATYNISETNYMVCCLWSVPISGTVRDNWFNVAIKEQGACDKDLWNTMYKEARKAKDGELAVENKELQIGLKGRMDDNGKALLGIDMYDL